MRHNRIKITGAIIGLLVVVLVVIPVWLGFQAHRQDALDQDLFEAVQDWDAGGVRRLLAEGASPNAYEDTAGRRSLWKFIAAEVERALHRKPDGARHGESALAAAVTWNRAEIVEPLLAHGATGVDDEASPYGSPPYTGPLLVVAVCNGNAAIVSDMIQHGASIDKPDSDSRTALEIACERGPTPVVERLLDAGANMDAWDQQGFTPLMVAVFYRNRHALVALVARGADPNACGKKVTPLMEALFPDGGKADVVAVKALLKAGADPNLSDSGGLTPLMYAASYAHVDVVRELLAAGADGYQQDNQGYVALSYAYTAHNTAVAKLLKTEWLNGER